MCLNTTHKAYTLDPVSSCSGYPQARRDWNAVQHVRTATRPPSNDLIRRIQALDLRR